MFLRCLKCLAVNYLHVCDLLDDFSINSSLMLRTCFFLPFLYWSCVINSIIGLRITVSGSTNIFTQLVLCFEEMSNINVTPHRHSENFYKGDATLMWYISESNALIFKTRSNIYQHAGWWLICRGKVHIIQYTEGYL